VEFELMLLIFTKSGRTARCFEGVGFVCRINVRGKNKKHQFKFHIEKSLQNVAILSKVHLTWIFGVGDVWG
jgi:hypothetical protein